MKGKIGDKARLQHIIDSINEIRSAVEGETKENYITLNNATEMNALSVNGNKRYWILEIHFVDTENEIGGFFEQLLV